MPESPKISVVIPTYNAAATIVDTLKSVLTQTHPAHEIVIVDDGSRDATLQTVRDFAPQVRLVTQPNAGPAAARNHGIRIAVGDWIALLDADDSWLPHKLGRQVREIADDVVLIHTHTVGDKGKNNHALDFDQLWQHNYIGTSTVLLRKSAFDAVGGFLEDRQLIGVEDYNLWLRMSAQGGRIVTVREELTRYTPAEGNLSSQTARVIQAELANLDSVSTLCNIPAVKVREKRAAVLDEYARALFWMRDLKEARKAYRELLRYRPTAKNLSYWLACHAPQWLLDANRQSPPAKNATLLQAANVVPTR